MYVCHHCLALIGFNVIQWEGYARKEFNFYSYRHNKQQRYRGEQKKKKKKTDTVLKKIHRIFLNHDPVATPLSLIITNCY